MIAACTNPQARVTKNDYFLSMLQTATVRGFHPDYVCFDSWYSSLENRKAIRSHGWYFLTRLKHNRQVNPDDTGNVAIDHVAIPLAGRSVQLKRYGYIQVFRIVFPHGDRKQWATSASTMTESVCAELSRPVFAIENYHRQLKQCCGIERDQVRKAAAPKSYILLSVRAFVRLEAHRMQTRMSSYAAKASLIREAIRLYFQNPTIRLQTTA